jgi:hypothetical protein
VSLQKRIELRSDAPLAQPESGAEPVPGMLTLRDAG